MYTCEDCGWRIISDEIITCPICNHVDQTVTQAQKSFYIRKLLCDGCKYRIPKGCALYIKPCTVKQLWHDQIDPPTLCPKKTEFEE